MSNQFSEREFRIDSRELANAIRDDALSLVYSPVMARTGYRILCVHAQPRWSHPKFGLLDPTRVGEDQPEVRANLVGWTLRQVLDDLVLWRRQGHTFRVALTLTPQDLKAESQLPDWSANLSRRSLTGTDLVVEFPERALAIPSTNLNRIREVQAHGVTVAITQYGASDSAVHTLSSLPVSILKVDEAIISSMPTDETSRLMAKACLDLGYDLGLDVYAAGVDHAPTARIVREMGFDGMQGLALAGSMIRESMTRWLLSPRPHSTLPAANPSRD